MKIKFAFPGLILALLAAGCVQSGGSSSSDDAVQDDPYSIIVSPVAYGSIVPSRKNAAHNANINLTIIPNAGYEFVSGTLNVTAINDESNVSVSGGGNSRSFKMPASHVIVSAEFRPVMYSISIAQTVNGSITSSHTEAAIGTVIVLTITPDTGYTLLEDTLSIMQEDGTLVNRTSYIFTMPASNVTISAQFSFLYNISINKTGPGDVFASHESVVSGAPITIVLTPDEGHRIKDGSFSVKGTANSTQITTALTVTEYYIQTHTFAMPAFDITVSVEFEEIPPGVIAVYFEGFYDEEMDLSQDGHIIKYGSNDTITVTIARGFDSYYWYLNDIPRSEKGYRITIDSYRLDLGVHTITAVVVKNGVPYSKIVTFTVVN